MSIFDKYAGTVKDATYTPLQIVPQTEIDAAQRTHQAEEDVLRDKTTFGDVLGATMAGQTIGTVHRAYQEAQFEDNPNFRITDKDVQRWRDQGIPEEYWSLFERATSTDKLDWLETVALQNKFRDEELSHAGGVEKFIASAMDPGYAALDAVAAPLGALGAATRASRAIRAGLIAGGENAALTAFSAHYDPNITKGEIAGSGVLGFALGGALGSLGRGFTPKETAGLDGAARRVKDALDGGPGSEAFAKASEADSMGAARVEGSPVARDDAPTPMSEDEIVQHRADRAAQEAGLKGLFLPIRFSIGAAFAKSKSNLERLVGRDLIGDSTGALKDTTTGARVTVKQSALQHKEQHIAQLSAPMLRGFKDAFSTFREANNINALDHGAWMDFRASVGRYIRDNSVEVHQSVKDAAAVMEDFYGRFGEHLRDSGVTGFENFTRAQAKGYLRREGSRDGLEKMLQHKGLAFDDVAEQLVGGAIKQARRAAGEEIDDAVTKEVSKAWLKRMYNRAMGVAPKMHRGMAQHDLEGIKAALMENGATAEHADTVLAKFHAQAIEKSKHPRAKPRIKMDETFKTEIADENGNMHAVSMSDLLNNDVLDLGMKYADEMSGWAGLSARADIHSPADLTRLREQLHEDVRLVRQGDEKAAGASVDRMDMAVRHILGRKLDPNENEAWARTSRIVRSNAFMTMMGQVGFTMTAEFGPILAHGGFVNGLRAIPVATAMLRKARSGTWAAEEAGAAEQIIHMGFERPSMLRVSTAADSLKVKVLNGVENKLDFGKRVVAWGSGMLPMIHFQQRMAGASTIYRLMQLAGKDKIGRGMQQRLLSFGLDEAKQKRLFGLLRGKKNIADLDFAKWSPEDQTLLSDTAWRVSHQMVFEGDFASTIPMMHSSTGKMVWQFRGFMTSSYERHFLNSLAHLNDWSSGMMFVMSTVFAGMGWTARAYLNTIGDPEARAKILTPKNIAASSFMQSSYSSFLPGMIDFVWADLLRNDGIFRYGRSTGNAGSLVGGLTPITMGNKIFSALAIPGAAIRDDKQVTRAQVKAALTALLVPNFTGIRNLIDQSVSELPKRETIYQEE